MRAKLFALLQRGMRSTWLAACLALVAPCSGNVHACVRRIMQHKPRRLHNVVCSEGSLALA